MIKNLSFAAIMGLLVLPAGAVSYTTGFGDLPGDAAFTTSPPASPLSGQDGWYTNDVGAPNTSFVATTAGGNVGAIGGFYTTPTFASTFVGHDYTGTLLNTGFSVDFNITSSAAVGGDSFGFTFLDGLGNSVFALTFTPDALGTTYSIGYSTGGGAITATTASFSSDSAYTLGLTFSGSGADALFAGTIGGGGGDVTFGGTVAGGATANLEAFGATWTKGLNPLDTNFMSFDNLAVPEPTGAALAGLALGGLLIRRRRA